MKLTDFGANANSIYRYVVEIRDNKTPLCEVEDWLEKNQFAASILPGYVYFKNHEDAVIFILKWNN
jgi:hypothetical protein